MAEPMHLIRLATELGNRLQMRGWRVATAESCTGGGVSAAITAIPGSSNWFEYGLVTYANAAKQHLLGVDSHTLANEGAVSEAVVRQMIDGVLPLSGAEIAVAVSGVAGPGGGSPHKPVGTVWFCWGTINGQRKAVCHQLSGDRQRIQQQAVVVALEGLLMMLQEHSEKPE